MEIWLNPRCSKSLAAVADLDAAGVAYTVRRYLDDPPDSGELIDVLDRLGLKPWDLARLDEPTARKFGLAHWPRDPENTLRWVRVLVENPELIQRPILTAADGTTVIGRSPDSIAAVLDAERRA